MFKRLFGGGNADESSSFARYREWVSRLPEQEVIGVSGSESDNSIVSWFKTEHANVVNVYLRHGKIEWGKWNSFTLDKFWQDTEPWMGQVLTLAGNRTGKITAAMTLADCQQIVAAMNAVSQAITVKEQDDSALLSAPPLPGGKQQGQLADKLRLSCWYCHRALPNNVARSVKDITEQFVSADNSSASTARIITFTCPHCHRENVQQMDMQGTITVRDTTDGQPSA